MQAKDFFLEAVVQATAIIDQVQDEDLSLPTPSNNWDVRTLLSDMLSGLKQSTSVLQGRVSDEGNLVENSIKMQVAWHNALSVAERTLQSVRDADMVHTEYGEMSAEEYLALAGSTQLLHTWDLAKGLDAPINVSIHLVREAHAFLEPLQNVMLRMGVFTPPITVPADAILLDRLVALTGRNPLWKSRAVDAHL